MGKRSKSVAFDPNPQVYAASCSGHDFSVVAGTEAMPSAASSGPPDLDIVSGFAFLSFDSLDSLESHIDVNEAKTSSLSVQVAHERPQYNTPPQRARKKAKTSRKYVKPKSKKPAPKPKQQPESETGLTQQQCPPSDVDAPSGPFQAAATSTSTTRVEPETVEEISLLCSETIPEDEIRDVEITPRPPPVHSDVLVALPAAAVLVEIPEQPPHTPATDSELLPKKRKKKRKDHDLCDQTSQTMFRIKKKKKKPKCNLVQVNQPPNKVLSSGQTASLIIPETSSGFGKDASINLTTIQSGDNQMPQIHPLNKEADVREQMALGGKDVKIEYFDQEVEILEDGQLSAKPKKGKVEKIDWCSRSAGEHIIHKYRALKQEEKYAIESEMDRMLDSTTTTPEGSDVDPDIREKHLSSVVKMEDATPSETSSDEMPKEFLFSNETFIIERESNESEGDPGDLEVDVESVDRSLAKNFIVVSGFKETPNVPVGHFSFHPHLTRTGTVDTSIQIYGNEIDIYLKCAMLQQGEIIKVITPDKDEFEGTGQCAGQSSGLVKAVRSLTERKRRNVLGQMFTSLKTEVFTDHVDKDLYFSKQTILTKACATVEELVNQNEQLTAVKMQLKAQNKELQTRLNQLLFGEGSSPDQVVNTEKLSSVLEELNIEVEEPVEDVIDLVRPSTVAPPPPASPPPPRPTTAQMTQTAQTSSAVYRDENRGYCTLVKTTTMTTTAETMSTASASKSSQVVLISTTSANQPVVTPMKGTSTWQVSIPSNKIVCNLSRMSAQRSIGDTSNFCLVTDVKPIMKSLERKNVVHIKIANDMLKQIDDVKSSPEKQEKVPAEHKNPTSATMPGVKPQVMLGTLIAQKVGPPTKKLVVPPRTTQAGHQELIRSQGKVQQQSSARPLRPILPQPPVGTDMLAGISTIVKTVNTPTVLQHLSLPQQPGSSTPIVFPKVQDAVHLKVTEPGDPVTQPTPNPQPINYIDGLQGVVNKLSTGQQTVDKKVMVPEVILSQPTSLGPKQVKLGSMSSVSNPSSYVPSSSVISITQPSTMGSAIGTIPVVTTQPSAPGGSLSSSPGVKVILGTVSRINAPVTSAVQGGISHQQKISHLNTSSQATLPVPRLPGVVISATVPPDSKTASELLSRGATPISVAHYGPSSSPSSRCSVSVSSSGGLPSVQTGPRILQTKVAPVDNVMVPLTTQAQGSQQLCATAPTTTPGVALSVAPGTVQNRQVMMRLPSTSVCSVLPPSSLASHVIPFHPIPGRSGIVNPNPAIMQLTQKTVQASTLSTSTTHYSSPSAQVQQSVFPQSITSATGVKVSSSVPGSKANMKVIQLSEMPPSMVQHSLPSTQVQQSMIPKIISSPTNVKVGSGVPMAQASPKVIQLIQTPPSALQYTSQSAQVQQSTFQESILSATGVKVSSGVPVGQGSPKVIQLIQTPPSTMEYTLQRTPAQQSMFSQSIPSSTGVKVGSGIPMRQASPKGTQLSQMPPSTVQYTSLSAQVPQSIPSSTGVNVSSGIPVGQATPKVTQPSPMPPFTLQYSLPSAQIQQSMFPQSIPSSTGCGVSSGVSVSKANPKVIHPSQVPGTLQVQPGSATHPSTIISSPVVMVDKPWITACQVSAGESLTQHDNQGNPLLQSSNFKLPSETIDVQNPLQMSQPSVINVGAPMSSLPQALPSSGNFSSGIGWPQVPQMAPVLHSIIPKAGHVGTLAQAEDASNVPSAFVTRIPATDWRESVDIPYLLSGDDVEASDETVDTTPFDVAVSKTPVTQCEGSKPKKDPAMLHFDIQDHTYSKCRSAVWPTSS